MANTNILKYIFGYRVPNIGVYENSWHLNVLEKLKHDDLVTGFHKNAPFNFCTKE
jgi:hypothetical protein